GSRSRRSSMLLFSRRPRYAANNGMESSRIGESEDKSCRNQDFRMFRCDRAVKVGGPTDAIMTLTAPIRSRRRGGSVRDNARVPHQVETERAPKSTPAKFSVARVVILATPRVRRLLVLPFPPLRPRPGARQRNHRAA